MNMKGKTVVIGITGGIAAYKMAQVCSDLIKKGVDVHVIMTKNATEFIAPLVFETLTNNRVSVDTFDRNFQWNVQHVSLAKKADVFLVAPATANIMAKMAWSMILFTGAIIGCAPSGLGYGRCVWPPCPRRRCR